MKQQEQPYSSTIWDEVETWSRDRIESFQLDALRRQLQRVDETSSHYRKVFAAAGFRPGDLKSFADLRRLPSRASPTTSPASRPSRPSAASPQ